MMIRVASTLLLSIVLQVTALAGEARLIIESNEPAVVTLDDRWSRGASTHHEFRWSSLPKDSYDTMTVEANCNGQVLSREVRVVEGTTKTVQFAFTQWPEPEWHRPPDGVVYPPPPTPMPGVVAPHSHPEPCCDEEEPAVPWTCCDKWLVFGSVALLLLTLLNLLWFWLWWKRWHPYHCPASPGKPNPPRVTT